MSGKRSDLYSQDNMVAPSATDSSRHRTSSMRSIGISSTEERRFEESVAAPSVVHDCIVAAMKIAELCYINISAEKNDVEYTRREGRHRNDR